MQNEVKSLRENGGVAVATWQKRGWKATDKWDTLHQWPGWLLSVMLSQINATSHPLVMFLDLVCKTIRLPILAFAPPRNQWELSSSVRCRAERS